MEMNRVESFSDGVIAVIITIMVLELKVPHGADLAALSDSVPVFLGYVLSFVFIGIYWNNHPHLVHTVEHVDGKIMWANLHLLFWLSLVPVATGWLGENHEERRKIFTSIKFETAHPVVRVHPITGERGLFIGGFAQRIIGLSGSESRRILDIFQHYVTRPENVLRWRWSPNQLVLFDNRITQHYAIDNYDDQPRRLNRVTVAGDVPVGVDGTSSHSLKGDASHYTPVFTTAAAEA